VIEIETHRLFGLRHSERDLVRVFFYERISVAAPGDYHAAGAA